MSWKRAVRPTAVVLAIGVLLLTLWSLHRGSPGNSASRARLPTTAPSSPTSAKATTHTYVAPPFRNPLPGMAPVVANDVYSQTHAGMLAPLVRQDPRYLYVPDSQGSRVTVIKSAWASAMPCSRASVVAKASLVTTSSVMSRAVA